MSQTPFEEFIKRSRSALSKKKQSTDYRGLNTKQNYSKFWMDDDWNTDSKFGGLGTAGGTSDIIKAIKLTNYQRAITNFVKIVTKKDIPVRFEGSNSFTDGKSITVSTDIKDNNFDVTVGLALHESSHILLTDFGILKSLFSGEIAAVESMLDSHKLTSSEQRDAKQLVKDLLNWIEDRRIDNYIFTTSPGYKAYYHKMYDHYWNSTDIIKGFFEPKLRNAASQLSYLFHIINSLSPNYNPTVLPGLQEITDIIDVRNIARVQNTTEALDIAIAVANIILANITLAASKQQSDDGGGAGSNAADDNSEDTNDDGDTLELTPEELRALENAISAQKDFLRGEFGKKVGSRKLSKQLAKSAEDAVTMQQVGNTDGVRSITALQYDCTGNSVTNMLATNAAIDALKTAANDAHSAGNNKLHAELNDQRYALERDSYDETTLRDWFNSDRSAYKEAILKGIDMGGLLGKRLQLHNEARIRVDNRLRNGKIDNSRLAHAGYGIESVFNQIHVDAYKKANLHISLDGSGSMSGPKWIATLQMTMAIVKAASYTQNIAVQVSIRATVPARNDTPVNLHVYDSRKNKVAHAARVLGMYNCNSMTPEGLCFEAMLKQNNLIPAGRESQSYFLNISDGAPNTVQYSGTAAVMHTKRQVDKMRNELGMQIISFYLEGITDHALLVTRFNGTNGDAFRRMYGKDAAVANPESALDIAKILNKKFLTK